MSRPERSWQEADGVDVDETVARWESALPEREVAWPTASRPDRRERERVEEDAAIKPRRRVRYGRLALVVLGGYLAVMAVSGEATLMHVDAQANALARQAATLQAQNRVLAQRVKLLHTVSYTDELARTEMGYVSPGEVPFVPVSQPGAAKK